MTKEGPTPARDVLQNPLRTVPPRKGGLATVPQLYPSNGPSAPPQPFQLSLNWAEPVAMARRTPAGKEKDESARLHPKAVSEVRVTTDFRARAPTAFPTSLCGIPHAWAWPQGRLA